MAFNTKNIITDAGTLPVPQYFNPASDAYEVALGTGGAINVNVTGTVTVGTHAVTISGTPAVTMASTSVAGTAAHDGVTLPNPVLIGAFANATATTAVANNDFTRLWADLNGRLATWNPPIGTHANAWSAIAVAANGVSASLDTNYCQLISVFGNSSVATTLTIQYSQDNVNFYDSTQTISAPIGNFGVTFDTAARYIRLKSSAASTITATIAAKS